MNASFHRPCWIIGNWKMHKTVGEAEEFLRSLLSHSPPSEKTIGLAVPFTALYTLSQAAAGSFVKIGAQNMNAADEGAFTGEIAATMLQEAGATFVLLGHSERRRFFSEDTGVVNRKVQKALQIDLLPIVCIGELHFTETTELTQEFLKTQICETLAEIPAEALARVALAYEPVWATGRGKPADPSYVQEMHLFCRKILQELANEEIAHRIPILYGGSITGENAHQFLQQPDVDGLLIGGASLFVESFVQIMNDGADPSSLEQGIDNP